MLKKLWVGIILLLGLVLFSFPVSAYPDFYISLSPDSVSICPTSTVGHDKGMEATIRNEGEVADTYELSLEFPDSEWSGFIQGEIILGPGEESQIGAVWITPGRDVKPGTYTVKITAKSKTYGDEREAELEVEILKCHQVDLELPKSGETCRGTALEVEINIINYGKYKETFSLGASVNWAKFPADTISVKSGEKESLSMSLEPPMDITGIESITVTLESLDSYAKDEETINLDIQDCYSFDASLEPASQSVCRGKPANYVLRISNTGLEEDSYSIFSPDWISPADSESVSLASGESRDIVLSASPVGTGEFRFNITVMSSRHPLYPELRKVIQGLADARECRGVAVVVSPPSSEICSTGEETEYQVSVKNIGTVTDTFELETSLGILEEDKLVLEAGESGTVKLTIGPDVSPGSKTIKVGASSNGVYDEDEAELIVENCYSAGIRIEPENASVCPCLSAEFEAVLENLGRLPDTYNFSFISPENLGVADFEKVLELLPGESETFKLTVPIPCDTGAGSYEIRAGAESENTKEVQYATLLIKPIEECYSLELSAGKESRKTVIGKAAVFAITAKNTGGVKDTYRLLLVGPEWSYLSAGELSLEPGESRMLYLYVSPTYGSELKEYSLGVTAVSDHSSASLALMLGVVQNVTGAQEEEPTENVTANVSMNVSMPTGLIGEGVVISWKVIAVTLIALSIVVILITRFVILIR